MRSRDDEGNGVVVFLRRLDRGAFGDLMPPAPVPPVPAAAASLPIGSSSEPSLSSSNAFETGFEDEEDEEEGEGPEGDLSNEKGDELVATICAAS